MSLRMLSNVEAALARVLSFSRWSCCRGVDISTCTMPTMPFIGVRISWLIEARNSDLMRFADSAASRAFSRSLLSAVSSSLRRCSASSALRRSIAWSRNTASACAMRPTSSLRATNGICPPSWPVAKRCIRLVMRPSGRVRKCSAANTLLSSATASAATV